MALTSSSEKPLAMRSITVAGVCPDLNACIAATMSAGLRPTSRDTVVCAVRAAGWQPEQERAPGGASAGPAAEQIALHNAGARGGTAVSPTPPQKPPLATMIVSTRGISARRSIG